MEVKINRKRKKDTMTDNDFSNTSVSELDFLKRDVIADRKFNSTQAALQYMTLEDPNRDYFELSMKFEKAKEDLLLRSINSIMNPNIVIPREFYHFSVLRSAVYYSGHNLEKGMGFANLEKIGFSFLQTDNKIIVIGDRFSVIPESLDRRIFCNAVYDFFTYLAKESINGSYFLSQIEDFRSASIKNSAGVQTSNECFDQ